MVVNCLYHCGFLVELEDCCLLFDWVKGELPKEVNEKPVAVFISHSHPDHFDKDIFKKLACKPDTLFLPAKQIPLSEHQLEKLGMSEEQKKLLHRMPANADVTFMLAGKPLRVQTLVSTDTGVAFLVHYDGRCIYHAGDLNDWQWEGEDPAWNKKMRSDFLASLRALQGVEIDAAFAHLDPRQEHNASEGMKALMAAAEVKAVFPMHMWGKYETVPEWKQKLAPLGWADRLMPVEKDGQRFVL